MNDTDLIAHLDKERKIARLQDSRDQTHNDPRIMQCLDAETADRLFALCGG